MLTAFVTIATMMMMKPTHAHAKVQRYPLLSTAARSERILIVAPHIDDESIGAGGYAIDALANGAEVFVVFLTAGDCNRFSARLMHKTFEPTAMNYLSVGRARIDEANQAMKLLGIPPDHYFVLGYPDRGLRGMIDHPNAVVRAAGTHQRAVPYADALTPGAPYTFGSLMNDMRQVMLLTQPTTVIAPVAFDRHPDHSAAAEITDDTIEEMHIAPQRLGYLVHSKRVPTALVSTPERALLPPAKMQSFAWTTYTLSDRVQRMKTNLLMTYKSQRPYVFLLRNAFVRRNELFYVYPRPAASASFACATASASAS